MRITHTSRINYRIQHIVFVALFLAIIGLLAWLSNQYNLRTDWTAGQRNSLTEASIKLLETIDGPVQIRTYQDNDPMMTQAVKEILLRYRRHKTDLQFRILNPDLDVQQAKADNISLYGQSIIEYGDRRERIETLSEQSISNALIRLSRNSHPVILFSLGHGERDPQTDSNIGYSQLNQKLTEKGFQVGTINLLGSNIPQSTRTLVIASPDHQLHPGEVDKIIEYIERGGNLLWLQDPGELFGLQGIADRLGIEFSKGVVVDNNPTLRKTLRIQHPAVVPVISYHEHAITEQMRYNTLFPIASALSYTKLDDWQVSPLMKTLPGSWVETDGFVLDVKFEEDKGDLAGPLDLGLAMQRNLETGSQRIVVVGDSDFLANTYLGAGANLTLGMNMLNWLSEDDQLIAIEPREAPDMHLDMNDTQVAIIGFGFLLVIPLALLTGGIVIWLKRRNR